MLSEKLSEGIHFEIIPASDDNYAWHIRLLEEYPETVIEYGAIEIDGKNDMLNFSMNIVSSPDPDLSLDDLTFTEYCGRILGEVIEISLSSGSFLMQDKETGEVAGTDDFMQEVERLADEFGQDSSQYA